MQNSKRGLKWSKNLLFLLIPSTLTLLVLEVGMRVQRGRLSDTSLLTSKYYKVGAKETQSRAQYHPHLGWVPNLGSRQIGGKRYTVIEGNIRPNGQKEKSKTFTQNPPVLVVGDAFAFQTIGLSKVVPKNHKM